MSNADTDIDDLIKRGDQEALAHLSVGDAVKHYSLRHYGFHTFEHDFGHFIAAGLARGGKLMNYREAEHDKPLYQAGLEAEYIAAAYLTVFYGQATNIIDTSYCAPENLRMLSKKQYNNALDRWVEEIIERTTAINLNIVNEWQEQFHPDGPFSQNSQHNAGIRSFLKDLDDKTSLVGPFKRSVWKKDFWKPPVEEVRWHLEKALELYNRLQKEHPTLDPGYLICYLPTFPLKDFILDYDSPWDEKNRTARKALHDQLYKNTDKSAAANVALS